MQPKLQKALGCEKGNLDRVVPRCLLETAPFNLPYEWELRAISMQLLQEALTRLSYPYDVCFPPKSCRTVEIGAGLSLTHC
jgi:hypothetical protein